MRVQGGCRPHQSHPERRPVGLAALCVPLDGFCAGAVVVEVDMELLRSLCFKDCLLARRDPKVAKRTSAKIWPGRVGRDLHATERLSKTTPTLLAPLHRSRAPLDSVHFERRSSFSSSLSPLLPSHATSSPTSPTATVSTQYLLHCPRNRLRAPLSHLPLLPSARLIRVASSRWSRRQRCRPKRMVGPTCCCSCGCWRC